MKAVIYRVPTSPDIKAAEIIGVIDAPANLISVQCGEGESYVIGEGRDDTHYIELQYHSIREKQDYELDALPLPCKVEIEEQAYQIDEQPTFTFDAPGRYEINVDAGPKFLRKTFYVDN